MTVSSYSRPNPGRASQTMLMVLSYLVLIIGALFMLLPFAWMISASFKSLSEVIQVPPQWLPKTLDLRNYKEVFAQQPYFGRFFLNSVIVAVLTVLAVLFTSALAGYAFAKFHFPLKRALFIFVLCTMMIPFQIRMVPLFVQFSDWGLTDSYAGLVLPGIVEGFGIFLMRQFISSIPNDLMDAARMDGASEPGIFCAHHFAAGAAGALGAGHLYAHQQLGEFSMAVAHHQ